MITRNDVVRLLALAARGDQRTVGEDDVDDWHTIAQMHRWPARAAARIILEHRGSGADRPRISPAAITDRLRTLRGKAAESFEAPTIPADLPDHEYPAWLRARLADHVDALVDQWAATGTEPPRALPVPAARVRTLPELVAAAPAHVRAQLADATSRVQARRLPPAMS